jgi:hypothetical protein
MAAITGIDPGSTMAAAFTAGAWLSDAMSVLEEAECARAPLGCVAAEGPLCRKIVGAS